MHAWFIDSLIVAPLIISANCRPLLYYVTRLKSMHSATRLVWVQGYVIRKFIVWQVSYEPF